MSLIKKILGFSVCAAGMVLLSTAAVQAETVAMISSNKVNVRTEPSTGYDNVIKQYNEGESIDIISTEADGWFKIKEPSQSSGVAYVKGDYVMIAQVDGVVNEDRINIREGSSTDTTVLGTLNKGDKISVTGSEGLFYMFSMEGRTGYIFKDFVNVDKGFVGSIQEQDHVEIVMTSSSSSGSSTKGTSYTYAEVVSSTGVNLRKGPSTDEGVIFAIGKGDLVDVIGLNGEWFKVSFGGAEGYVNAAFVEASTGSKPAVNAKSDKASALISFAKKYLGTPYVWGGTNLNSGVDCSGFVYSVFKNFGYGLNRTSRDQIYNGDRVDRANLQAGDLVFFDTNMNNTISHVGIYIGGGDFIHSCSGSKTMCVTISNLNEAYYTTRYMGGCRVIY